MTRAQKFAADLVWRLEILQRRSRYVHSTGQFTTLPTRIRRFSNACPGSMISEVIDAIVAAAPYSGLLFNGEKLPADVRYRPTYTVIRKDDSLKTGTNDRGTYTIIQDLILIGEPDELAIRDLSSCSQVTESQYFWDEAEIPACPEGGQGVTYTISDVSRDKETDLFSYRLRKSTAITQHSPERVSGCTDDEVKYVETWDNVYGEEGAYRFDNVVHAGDAIQLPEPCSSETGETVEVDVDENDDCTFKIKVTRTVSKVEVSEYSIYRDQFVIREMELTSHAHVPLDRTGVEYADGVKTTYDTKSNPDGTFENRITTETERPTEASVVEFRKTLRAVLRSQTDRNQTDSLDGFGMKIGESRRSERTEGGLFNNTVTEVTLEPVGEIASDCAKTVFEHRHSTTENVAVEPAEKEASSAGEGRTYRKTTRTTEEGTFDVTEEETEEIEQPSAQVVRRKTLRGILETIVDRNTDNDDTAVEAIGDEVRIEKTPGGLWNRTVTRVVPVAVGEIASDCAKTVFEHRHSTTENVATEPTEKEASAAGEGKTYRKSTRTTEEGTFDVVEESTEEISQPSSRVTRRKTLRGIIETIVDRNTDNNDTIVEAIGDEVQIEKTPGGLWNRTVTRVVPTAVGEIASDCTKTVFEHRHSTTENVATEPTEKEASAAGEGKTYRKSTRTTEEGTFDVVEESTEEIEQPASQVVRRKTLRGVIETTTDRNTNNDDTTVEAIGDEVRIEKTPGGLWNRTVTHVTPEPVGEIASDCRKNVFEHTHSRTENVAAEPTEKEASAAGEGKTYRKSTRTTEEGTFDVVEESTEEISQPSSQVTRRKTLRGIIETIVDRNTDNNDTVVEAIGDEVRIEKTPGGLWNRTVTRLIKEPVGKIEGACERAEHVHTDSTTENVADEPDIEQGASPGVNKSVTKTATMTEQGSWDMKTRETTYTPAVATSEVKWCTETVRTTTTHHDEDKNKIVESDFGETSSRPDDYGAADTTVTEYIPHEVDSGWLTWDSETKTSRGTYKYHHGVRIFKNLVTPPTPPRGSASNISVTINKYGLYDGTVTYTDLYDWVEDSGGGGSGGGIQQGSISFYQYKHDALGKSWRRVITVPVIRYYGRGNEGSEASTAVNQTLVAGLSLPGRTYATGAPSEGQWQSND